MGGFFQLTPAYTLTNPDDKNSVYEVPKDGDVRLHWLNAAFEEAMYENAQSEELQAMSRYIDYLMGKQWPKGRASYKSKPVNNRIWSLFWEMVALLTDLRPTVDTKATRTEFDAAAAAITSATHAWWLESDADQDLVMAIIYAILSTGWTKLEWDASLRNGWGDFNLLPISPNHVAALRVQGYDIDTAQAVVYYTPQPLNFFRRRFRQRRQGATGTGFEVTADAQLSNWVLPPKPPKHLTPYQFSQLSLGMQRKLAGPAQMMGSSFPMAWYKEFWIKDETTNERSTEVLMGDPYSNWCYRVAPGDPLYPRGRLLVQGGNVILYDGPNPYWHGTHPFGCLRMNIVPWSFHGLSDLKSLCDLQDVTNNILAGVMDMVKRALNPGFTAPKNAFTDAEWRSMDWSMPGFKAAYAIQSQTPPSFAPSPQLPAWVFQVLGLADRAMDTTSGLATINEIIRKRQLPSADTIEQARQTQQTPIRLKGRNIEVYLRRHGRQNQWNMLQFYTSDRRMFLQDRPGDPLKPFDWQPQEFLKVDGKPENPQDVARHMVFTIPPGSLLGVNRIEQSALYMNLRKLNALSIQTLWKQLELPIDPTQEMQRMQQETLIQAKTMAAARALAGGMPEGGAQ